MASHKPQNDFLIITNYKTKIIKKSIADKCSIRLHIEFPWINNQ